MENIALAGQLSQEIFNKTQTLVKHLSRPQQFNFREIIRGIIISGSTFLNYIGKANGAEGRERKTIERLSKTLSKIPTEKLAALHVQSQVSQYRDEAVLILSDGGDLQKPYAKKMEKVCGTIDGSDGHKAGRGYPLHGLMALGVEFGKLSPLALRTYSTLDENFKSEWAEQMKNFEMLLPLIKSSVCDRIVVEDRGCDDEKRFLYFVNKLEASFVTRIHAGKKSRNLAIKDEDGNIEILSVKELGAKLKKKAGAERRWWNQKIKRNLKSTIIFQEVFLPGHLNIPMYAIFCFSEGYEEPLVILTDLKTDNFKKAWKHFFYYKKRWEVENFYRAIKNQFGAEKFLILDFEKIKALIFAVMLAYSLLMKIREKMRDFLGLLYRIFKDFCERKQRSGNHHLDLLAFLRDHFTQSATGDSYRFYSRRLRQCLYPSTKNQLKLFDFRKLW